MYFDSRLRRFVLVLVHSVITSTASFSTQTFTGKYLSEHEIVSPRVDDWMGCIEQCHNKPSCLSYNYHAEKNVCWLNDHGIEETGELDVDDQLLNYNGWLFQQLRPVTKTTNKRKRKTSCPCNCGSADQCYPEPGIGDVPEKAGKSCRDIIDRRGLVPNGGYYLHQNAHKVYCQMTPISECDADSGGWTLVMKINGNNSTFKFDAELWKSKSAYQAEYGSDLTEREAKLNTYDKLTFQEMCLGMRKINSTIKWVKSGIKRGAQMYSIIKSLEQPQYILASAEKWKTLIPGSELDTVKTEEGFNKESPNSKVRIGILGFDQGAARSASSYIGFGTGGTDEMGRISCGNMNDNQPIPAFGYILVR